MRAVRQIFFTWLPLAGATTGILLICYAGIQQNYRQSLNDPQIQMAEDAATAIGSGVLIERIVPVGAVGTVDLATSLAPWIGVYDANGKALVSSGILDGAMPQPPPGIFEDLKNSTAHGAGIKTLGKVLLIERTNRSGLSWQPQPDIRQAIIVAEVKGGANAGDFVVAGRNMREVEDRIGNLGVMFLLGWLVLMAATLLAKVLGYLFG